MLIQHITRYDVGEQIGRNRQAVRPFFQVDKRRNLKSTVGGIAVRHVKFVEQAVSVGLTNLAYIVASGYNTAVGIDSTPVEFKLLFEIVFYRRYSYMSGRRMLSAYVLYRSLLHQRCSLRSRQVIGGCRMALPRVAVVQIGGVDT